MKYVKGVVLIAAAAALMVIASTASATTLTSPTGTTYTGAFKGESEGRTVIHGAFVSVECSQSSFESSVEDHGFSKTVKGKISSLTFSECNYSTTVLSAGSGEFHPVNCSGYCDFTVTSTGREISIATSVGTCVFTTANTDIGTVTGTNKTGGNMTVHMKGKIPRTGGNFLCGSSGEWTGSYKITTPATGWIDA